MDEKTTGFLSDLEMSNPAHYRIIIRVSSLIFQAVPDIEEVFMYGGLIYKTGLPVFGLFSRQKHVTFEIEEGFKLNDPDLVLEGKGIRRHIVLISEKDIDSKKVWEYIKQKISGG